MNVIIVRNGNTEYNVEYTFNNITYHSDTDEMKKGLLIG